MSINSICKQVLKTSDEEIVELDRLAADQTEYIHPLKYAKAARLHDCGSHNQRVLAQFKALRDVLKAGAESFQKSKT